MIRRTLRRRYASPASEAATWAYLVDPCAWADASSHAKSVPDPGPLAVGVEWDEYHLEDDCEFDSVRWRCTAFDDGRSLTIEGLQSGVRQRSTTSLEPAASGVDVVVRLSLESTWRAPASFAERLLVPVMLVLPFGVRLLEEGLDEVVGDDLRALRALSA